MNLSGYIPEGALDGAGRAADLAVELGMKRIWSQELAHDPFLPLAFAASAQPTLAIGTGIAVGFARSPFTVAEVSWDLHRISGGRFTLGFGTQVRAHIQRRFGMQWHPPIGWLRDYVGALRAIFATWEEGVPLDYQGTHYKLDLISEPFKPGPNGFPPPAIWLSGVSRGMCSVAGEVADGFLAHAFNSPRYLNDVVLPALAAHSRHVPLHTTAWIGVGDDSSGIEQAREKLRGTVAWYASTPSYRAVLETHGFEEVGERLSEVARAQKWDRLAHLVPDEMVDTYTVFGTPRDVGETLRRRYAGIAEGVAIYHFVDDSTRDGWADMLAGFDRAGETSRRLEPAP